MLVARRTPTARQKYCDNGIERSVVCQRIAVGKIVVQEAVVQP
jgi:hypothetical protein